MFFNTCLLGGQILLTPAIEKIIFSSAMRFLLNKAQIWLFSSIVHSLNPALERLLSYFLNYGRPTIDYGLINSIFAEN